MVQSILCILVERRIIRVCLIRERLSFYVIMVWDLCNETVPSCCFWDKEMGGQFSD